MATADQVALPLILDDVVRETLERWVRRPKTAQALALRARMILGCAEGRSNTPRWAPTWECPMRRWGNGVPDSWNGGWTDCRTNRAADGLERLPMTTWSV